MELNQEEFPGVRYDGAKLAAMRTLGRFLGSGEPLMVVRG